MITKREILDAASKLNLNPHVVEKDYALGWALAGIFAQDELAENWVFKGGTCLKKCYFRPPKHHLKRPHFLDSYPQ